MSSSRSKTGSVFIIGVIALIIVAFIITGIDTSYLGTSNELGKVAGQPIKLSEYRQEFSRQSKIYEQFFKSGPLNKQQIEQFSVRQNVINSLINRKLLLALADELKLTPSKTAIKEVIKSYDAFKDNGQFSLNLYKNVLKSNRMTPDDFEGLMRDDIKMQSIQKIYSNLSLPAPLAQFATTSKGQGLAVTHITLEDKSLVQLIPVTSAEIKAYLSNKANMSKVETTFGSRRPQLDRPETITASHILVRGTDAKSLKKINNIKKKVTAKNFSQIANTFTEDPSGKKKGGALGTFGKGQMVAEFDKVAFTLAPGKISKPVKTQFGYHLILVKKKNKAFKAKLKDHQDKIAKELIQKSRDKEVAELVKTAVAEFTSALKGNKVSKKKLQRLITKYKAQKKEVANANILNGDLDVPELGHEELLALYNDASRRPVVTKTISKPVKTLILRAVQKESNKVSKSDIKEEAKSLAQVWGRKLNEGLIEQLKVRYSEKAAFEEIMPKVMTLVSQRVLP